MDTVPPAADPKDEVKKLQTLVRHLELQNAQLRSRQGSKSSSTKPQTLSKRLSSTSNVEKASLADVEIINLEDFDFSDEDSWLFKSPKKLTDEEKSVSPYKWMRRDVEDPENTDLQTIKQALVNKLDDFTRVRVGSSSHLHLHTKKNPVEGELIPPQLKASLGFNRTIDTRAFTRPKKRKDGEKDSKIPTVLPVKSSPIGESAISEHYAECLDMSENDGQSTASESGYSLSSLHRLADVVDVQALARMQEENLRECLPVSALSRRESESSSIPSTDSPIMGFGSISRSNCDFLDDSLPPSQSDNNFASECLVEKLKAANSGTSRRSLPNLNKSHNTLLRTSVQGLRHHFSEPRIPDTIAPSRLGLKQSDEETPKIKESLPVSPASRSGIPIARRNESPADAATSRSHLPKSVQNRIAAVWTL